MGKDFKLLSELKNVEIIAVNLSIRERRRLRDYGNNLVVAGGGNSKVSGSCVFPTARLA
jgi:hypothetical protein